MAGSREEFEALLRRRLTPTQLHDLDRTGCFNVRLPKFWPDGLAGGQAIRVSTHNRPPAAIGVTSDVCFNAWPVGTAKNGMERALGILLLLKSCPAEFFGNCCHTYYPHHHMKR